MILQYKGFNQNWTYEQSGSITWAEVYIGDITKKYRDNGLADTQLKEMLFSIDAFIQAETKCADDLRFLLLSKAETLENVYVVTLKDKNREISYVFDTGVYILNDNGGTVQRIA